MVIFWTYMAYWYGFFIELLLFDGGIVAIICHFWVVNRWTCDIMIKTFNEAVETKYTAAN